MKKIFVLLTTACLAVQAWGQAVIFPQAQQAGTAQVSKSGEVYTLSNDLLSASFHVANGTLVFDGCEAMGLKAGGELFSIVLANGTEVAASQMTMGEVSTTTLAPDFTAAKGALRLPGKAIETTFTYGDLTMGWRAVLRDGSHYLRTELTLTAAADVEFKSIVPMHYTVDNGSSAQAPAVVGNTRGAVIASDKIFAGLETPMGKNAIVGSMPTERFNYGSWTSTTFAWQPGPETPQGILNLGLAASDIVGLQGYLAILQGGTQTVTFQYTSGNHRLDIAGVDLVDLSGNVVASDYHKGYTGGAKSNNVYTLNVPAPGYYLVRYFRDTATDAQSNFNSNGTITWSCSLIAPELLFDGNMEANVVPTIEASEQAVPADGTPAQTVIALDGNASDMWTPDLAAVTEVPAPVAAFGFTAANVVKKEKAVGFAAKGGILSATFTYQSGNHGLNIVGVELVGSDGSVVSADYHRGFSGGLKKYNTYTVYVPATGDYTLRYLFENKTESINSSGNIALSYAATTPFSDGSTRAESWTPALWQEEKHLPAGITSLDANYTTSTIRVSETTATVTTPGRLDVEFLYSSGNHRLEIAGVELVDNVGTVVSTDYHFGYTGNLKEGNTYKVYAPATGFYHLRYYVILKADNSDNDSSGDINLAYTAYPLLAVDATRTDGWTTTSWSTPASVAARINELGYTSDRIKTMAKPVRFNRSGGMFAAQFMYASGNHGLTIAGVELVDGYGNVVASDYHRGFSGTAKTDNTYSFTVAAAGFYELRYYVVLAADGSDNTSSGIINLNYTKTEYLHLPAPTETEIQGEWSRQTTLAAGKTWKVSSVVGLIAPGQARRSFLCYSERERAVPWRAFPMYNSWYELNIDRNNDPNYTGNFNEGQCMEVLNQWKTNLFDKYGVGIGSFVWDDGWDIYGTWEFNGNFPNGFQNLSDKAYSMNSQIGAWLGPVGGYGTSGNYRRSYWSSRGGMQLSNPDYYNVFLNRTSYMLNTYHFNAFKFDGISAQFSATGPDAGATGEENAEAIIDIELKLREVKPDVFFNTSVGTWASPFWFQVTDAVWRQENDWGTIGNQGNTREQWITYRDHLVYQNFVQNSPLCPINTLMTHGFMLSNYGGGVANMSRAYDDIVRELRCAFACGSGMVEVYADFAVMNSINDGALWGELADCIKWQQAQADVLPDVHWVGGNPWDGSRANVYGWAAWNGKKATLALRNPSASAQTFTTTLRQALDIPAYITTSITLADAFAQSALPGLTTGTPIDIDTQLTLNLAASSVYIYNGVDGLPLSLPASADNTAAISAATGQRRAVTLADRTLYKDNAWNSLCLPFDLDAQALATSPLAGATIKELDTETEGYEHATGFDAGTLYLNFKNANTIVAGKPYIVKWADGDNITNPLFAGVTIAGATTTDIASQDGAVAFRGIYAPVSIGAEGDDTKLYIGSNNNLFWPDGEMNIGSQCAFFQLNGINAGAPATGAQIKSFVLNFGDTATAVRHPQAVANTLPANLYTLDGRRVKSGHLPRGIYVSNGQKVVIR